MPVWLKTKPNNIEILHERLLDNYVNAWVERSFQIIPLHSMDTNLIPWKCFGCQKPINVKYNAKRPKDFCCKNCKQFTGSKPNAIMLRFMWSFNINVQNLLIKNSYNLDTLMGFKKDLTTPIK